MPRDTLSHTRRYVPRCLQGETRPHRAWARTRTRLESGSDARGEKWRSGHLWQKQDVRTGRRGTPREKNQTAASLTVRTTQELEGVPYDRPRRGARDLGSQRLHAAAAETEVCVAQEQKEDQEKQRHPQDENTAAASATFGTALDVVSISVAV